jgi:DNA/RNA endonuclease G (NUC1)
LIKKLWVKFNDMDVECFCEDHDRKCRDKQCKEYVVKFTEIERQKEVINLNKEEQMINNAIKKLKRSETELSKSIKKFGKIRIR